MKIAIMQPYLFPYIGYFQLIRAVDKFILLDDVNYINRGWINRNRIKFNGQEHLFTIPLKEASQNKLIYETEVAQDEKWRKKLLKTMEAAYRKSPSYSAVYPLLEQIVLSEEKKISKFILNSLHLLNHYLDIKTPLMESSSIPVDSHLKGQYRILALCKTQQCSEYINAKGGMELYSREYFAQNNIQLHFLESQEISYGQTTGEFIPWLSMLDVLFMNPKDQIQEFLIRYRLV